MWKKTTRYWHENIDTVLSKISQYLRRVYHIPVNTDRINTPIQQNPFIRELVCVCVCVVRKQAPLLFTKDTGRCCLAKLLDLP